MGFMNSIGLGIYSIPDAARLVGARAPAVHRWLFGYNGRVRSLDAGQRRYPPLWKPQYDASHTKRKYIGFLDLLELRIVREFVARGVPLVVVRQCLQTAQKLFGQDHPLTRRRFMTDGETIFHEAIDQVQPGLKPRALLDLKKRQYAFADIIQESLYAGIDYDGQDACRWYPDGKRTGIVLDPLFQDGQPIVQACGVPTAAVYAAWLAEGQKRATVARLFELDAVQVDAAVRFEQTLRQAA